MLLEAWKWFHYHQFIWCGHWAWQRNIRHSFQSVSFFYSSSNFQILNLNQHGFNRMGWGDSWGVWKGIDHPSHRLIHSISKKSCELPVPLMSSLVITTFISVFLTGTLGFFPVPSIVINLLISYIGFSATHTQLLSVGPFAAAFVGECLQTAISQSLFFACSSSHFTYCMVLRESLHIKRYCRHSLTCPLLPVSLFV